MTGYRSAQRSHWRHGLDLDPEQGGIVGVEPVFVAELGRIVRLHWQGRIGSSFTRRIGTVSLHGEVPTNNRLGGCCAHSVGPKVVYIIRLLELRYGSIGASGDKIDKDVIHGGCHGRGFWASIHESNDVIAVHQFASPE